MRLLIGATLFLGAAVGVSAMPMPDETPCNDTAEVQPVQNTTPGPSEEPSIVDLIKFIDWLNQISNGTAKVLPVQDPAPQPSGELDIFELVKIIDWIYGISNDTIQVADGLLNKMDPVDVTKSINRVVGEMNSLRKVRHRLLEFKDSLLENSANEPKPVDVRTVDHDIPPIPFISGIPSFPLPDERWACAEQCVRLNSFVLAPHHEAIGKFCYSQCRDDPKHKVVNATAASIAVKALENTTREQFCEAECSGVVHINKCLGDCRADKKEEAPPVPAIGDKGARDVVVPVPEGKQVLPEICALSCTNAGPDKKDCMRNCLRNPSLPTYDQIPLNGTDLVLAVFCTGHCKERGRGEKDCVRSCINGDKLGHDLPLKLPGQTVEDYDQIKWEKEHEWESQCFDKCATPLDEDTRLDCVKLCIGKGPVYEDYKIPTELNGPIKTNPSPPEPAESGGEV